MRNLIAITMMLAQISLASASRAENDFLGLDADLANFANGLFLYQELIQLESTASSADLFTQVRARAETALHRHKLRFLGLSAKQQARMIDQVRNISKFATSAKLVFPGDDMRTEVYGHLSSWSKGRLAGLIQEYNQIWRTEVEEQTQYQARLRLIRNVESSQREGSASDALLVDPNWSR